MKLNFGIRFVLATAISFILAFTVIYINWAGKNPFIVIGGELLSASTSLAMFLIILGYYFGLRTILKTRVGLLSYLIYVLIGVSQVLATFIQLIEFIIELEVSVFIPWEGLFWALFLPLGIAYIPPLLVYQMQKIREHPTFRQLLLGEQGGSASWASVGTFDALKGRLKQTLFTYWFNNKGVTADGIYLGRSLFSDDPFRRHVVIKDDGHNISMGLSGSGKTISVQNFTYSLYEGSIIGFDPKGELSLATANRRNHQNIGGNKETTKHFPNGRVYIADPFGLNAKHGFSSIHYNPLAEVEDDLSNARAIASDTSDACITPEDLANVHFEENPRNIFEGYIIHVLTSYPKKCHNLPFVYDLMRGINPKTGFLDLEYQKETILAMSKNQACGGLATEAARILIDMGPNERGSMQSTLSRHLKWIGEENMRRHLSKSDLSFKDYGTKKVNINGKQMDLIETLYIILPDPKIKEFMRYVRLMFTVSIRLMQTREEKPKVSTLIIIDEFPRLGGKVEVIAEGFGILRSYGVKLWCFIQNLGQLKHDYPKRWSSMIGNSTLQVFGAGMGDNETSEFVSRTLGSRMVRQYDRRKNAFGFSKKVVVNETPRELLTPAEVPTRLGKSAKMQIIFPNDGLPMRLERLAFKPMKFGRRRFKSLGLGGLRKQIEDIY